MAENKKNNDLEKMKAELKEEIKKEMMEELNKKNKTEEEKDTKNENKKEKSFEEKAKDTINKIMDTDEDTNDYDKKDIENNKIMAILAYLGPLVLIPFFVSKDSKFAMYHAKQGLNLFIIELVTGAVLYFLNIIFTFNCIFLSGVGCNVPFFISIPTDLIEVAFTVFSIMGLVYACQGKAKELPLIGKIRIIK